MSDTITDKPVRRRVAETPPVWWDPIARTHPMSDAEFIAAFVEYTMLRSDDHTLRKMRERASFFVRTLCQQEIEKSLKAYRAEYPL